MIKTAEEVMIRRREFLIDPPVIVSFGQGQVRLFNLLAVRIYRRFFDYGLTPEDHDAILQWEDDGGTPSDG